MAFDGEHVGQFRHRREALESALSDARRVGDLGHVTEVWARRRDGTVGAAWRYDRTQRRMQKETSEHSKQHRVFPC